MAIPFEGQNGSGTGTDGSAAGGCGGAGDGRDGRNNGNDDQRNNDNRKPKDIVDEEERTDQETNVDDETDNNNNNNNAPELLGAHGGGDFNSSQGEEVDDIPFLPLPETPRENMPAEALEAGALFRDFLNEELSHDGIRAQVTEIAPEITNIIENPALSHAGEDLRRVSLAVSQSPEREIIRQQAASVDLSELNSTNFRLMLGVVFQDGVITVERIIVLFFFCSDLARRAWKEGQNGVFGNLITWSLQFVMTNVAHWVRCRGGWAAVIRRAFQENQMSFCFAGLVALFTCVVLASRS